MSTRLVRKVFSTFGFDALVLTTIGRKSGTERAEAWQQITAAAPRFARFQQKTDRVLPVIRLIPDPALKHRRMASSGPPASGLRPEPGRLGRCAASRAR